MDSDGISRRSVLGGVGIAMAGGGCLATGKSPKPRASDWLQPRYDAGETCFKSEGDPPIKSVTESWRVELGTIETHRFYDSTKLIADETIYHGLGTAVDLSTGEIEARTDCVYGLVGFARTETYRDGVLLTRTDHDAPEDTIQAYTPTLDPIPASRCANGVRWTLGYPEDIDEYVAALLDDGEILLNSNPGRDNPGIVGVDPADGTVNWRQTVPDGGGSLLADDKWFYLFDDFYNVTSNHYSRRLVAVERSTGEVQARFERHPPGNMNAARDGIAYITLYLPKENTDRHEPELVALDVRSAERKWTLDVNQRLGTDITTVEGRSRSEITELAVGPDTVYVNFGRKILLAIDPTDGTIRWSKHSDWYSEMTATSEAVYVNGGSHIYCFDKQTGDAHWAYDLEGEHGLGRPIVADSRVLVETYTEDRGPDRSEPVEISLLALEEA